MMLQVRAAEENQPGGLGQALLPDGPQRGQVNINIYTISTYCLEIIYTISTQVCPGRREPEDVQTHLRLLPGGVAAGLGDQGGNRPHGGAAPNIYTISKQYLRNIYKISTQVGVLLTNGFENEHEDSSGRAV